MNKQQLASKIWESANKMRSKIEANEYKQFGANSEKIKKYRRFLRHRKMPSLRCKPPSPFG